MSYVFLPIFEIVKGSTPDEIINKLIAIRPPNIAGGQDDHTSAWALLLQGLYTQIKSAFETRRMHLIPVFTKLSEISQQEVRLYSDFIKSQNLVEKLKNIYKNIYKDTPTMAKYDRLSAGSPAMHIEAIIDDISEKILHTPVNARNKGLTKEFFTIWGHMMPYFELCNLQQELSSTVTKARDLWTDFLKEADDYAADDVSKQAGSTAGNASLKELEKSRKIFLDGKYREFKLAILGLITNASAQFLNKLPFATYRKVQDVSGTSDLGGTKVAQAMKTLREAVIGKSAEDTIIKAMGTLLDYQLLGSDIDRKTENDASKVVLKGKKKFINRAVYLSLTRNNDPIIFAHVAARHWRNICRAFPKFENQDTIKDQFIQYMLEKKWKVSTDQIKHIKEIERIIKTAADFVPRPLPEVDQRALSPLTIPEVTVAPSIGAVFKAAPTAVATGSSAGAGAGGGKNVGSISAADDSTVTNRYPWLNALIKDEASSAIPLATVAPLAAAGAGGAAGVGGASVADEGTLNDYNELRLKELDESSLKELLAALEEADTHLSKDEASLHIDTTTDAGPSKIVPRGTAGASGGGGGGGAGNLISAKMDDDDAAIDDFSTDDNTDAPPPLTGVRVGGDAGTGGAAPRSSIPSKRKASAFMAAALPMPNPMPHPVSGSGTGSAVSSDTSLGSGTTADSVSESPLKKLNTTGKTDTPTPTTHSALAAGAGATDPTSFNPSLNARLNDATSNLKDATLNLSAAKAPHAPTSPPAKSAFTPSLSSVHSAAPPPPPAPSPAAGAADGAAAGKGKTTSKPIKPSPPPPPLLYRPPR